MFELGNATADVRPLLLSTLHSRLSHSPQGRHTVYRLQHHHLVFQGTSGRLQLISSASSQERGRHLGEVLLGSLQPMHSRLLEVYRDLVVLDQQIVVVVGMIVILGVVVSVFPIIIYSVLLVSDIFLRYLVQLTMSLL